MPKTMPSVVFCGIGLLLLAGLISAADEPTTAPAAADRPTAEFRLWEGAVPLAKGTDAAKDVPTLTPFWAEKPTGAAMIICPGGGYGMLAEYEGKDYAIFLAHHGVDCFVLKYRLGSNGYRHPAMMYDVQRAIRYVRSDAAKWGIDPKRIGVMGSSAGGHLASVAATHFDEGNPSAPDEIDRVGCRPDIAVLAYPVIDMSGPVTHRGSMHNLLGSNPDPKLMEFLSSQLQVTKQTPPCFIYHRFEDKTVDMGNSLEFAAALRKAGVPFALHIYQKGGHGGGLGASPDDEAHMHPWTRDLLFWLRVQKFVD